MQDFQQLKIQTFVLFSYILWHNLENKNNIKFNKNRKRNQNNTPEQAGIKYFKKTKESFRM